MTGRKSSGPVGRRPIRIVRVPVPTHPDALVTREPRATLPLAPAVNVIARVVAPAVMVPPVIVQEYDAPAPASGTDAELADAAATLDGALIVASGEAMTVTGCPAEVA